MNLFRFPRLLLLLWAAAIAGVIVWAFADVPGWDAAVYWRAITSVSTHHDPYLDSIKLQSEWVSKHPDAVQNPPFGFVYPPIVLPLLRLAGLFPIWFTGALYWAAVAAGALAILWAGLQAAEPEERRAFLYVMPVAAFFPGLLLNDAILGGNIAFIFYGAILLAAIAAIRNGNWRWFYIAVVFASCIKLPFLTLLAIPVLLHHRQRASAVIAFGTGLAIFAVQYRFWPTLFRHYLDALDAQLRLNHDFGCSPAGLFSNFLQDHGLPHYIPSMVFYLAYAIPVVLGLHHLAGRYRSGNLSLRHFAPILLVGTVLLNPRLIEYDIYPITIPLALIAFRILCACRSPRLVMAFAIVFFLVLNGYGFNTWKLHKVLDGTLISIFFAADYWRLRGGGGHLPARVMPVASDARHRLVRT